MSTVVLKLFAGQGTGRTDGQSGDYMLPPLWSLKIGNMYTCDDKNGAETMYIAEHNNSKCYVQSNLKYIQKQMLSFYVSDIPPYLYFICYSTIS